MRSVTSPLSSRILRKIWGDKLIVSGENLSWKIARSNYPKGLDQLPLLLPSYRLLTKLPSRSKKYDSSKILGKTFGDTPLKDIFPKLDEDSQSCSVGNIENHVVSSLIKDAKSFEQDESSLNCTVEGNKLLFANYNLTSKYFENQNSDIIYDHNAHVGSHITGSSVKLLEESLKEKLLARPAIKIYDHMAPTPSHLLKLSLKSYLPFVKSCLDMELVNKGKFSLPPGHHLVYFHQHVATDHLLPDGTDNLHSPGFPFERRLWVGGSFDFTRTITLFPKIQMLCLEKIIDVRVTGICGDEKVFVDINRQIINPYLDSLELKEVRTLVFMRRSKSIEIVDRKIPPKPRMEPYYSIVIRPSRALLFRFSALTFNAHRIHLDSIYCRQVEGLKSMVVHGPLTAVLMLAVLTGQLWKRARIIGFTYKNITPLYVEEDMKICVKKGVKAEGISTWHVWIEEPNGGYAVKGTATISWTGRNDKSIKNKVSKEICMNGPSMSVRGIDKL